MHGDALLLPKETTDPGSGRLLRAQELAQVTLGDADLPAQAPLVSPIRVHFGNRLRCSVHSAQDIPSEKLVKRETRPPCQAVPVSPTKKNQISEIGSRIKRARDALVLTQEDILRSLGIPQPKLSKLENGHTGLRTNDMVALLTFLSERGVDVEGFILRRDTDEPLRASEPQTALVRRLAALEKKVEKKIASR